MSFDQVSRVLLVRVLFKIKRDINDDERSNYDSFVKCLSREFIIL